MRVAIVSDIHGNRRAFDAVVNDLRQVSPDRVLHGGDLAYGGAHSAEIIDAIRTYGWPGVRGNTDEMLWAPQQVVDLANRQPKLKPLLDRIQAAIPITCDWIGEERLSWLRDLPLRHTEGDITLVHAGPDDTWWSPMANATDEELQSAYGPLKTPALVYGHIHHPYIRSLPGMTVANSGAVSLSYDGDWRASYLVVDGKDVSIRRVEYDVESEANDLLNSGFPNAEWQTRILRAGRYCPPE
jgi:putative phosphoesterase